MITQKIMFSKSRMGFETSSGSTSNSRCIYNVYKNGYTQTLVKVSEQNHVEKNTEPPLNLRKVVIPYS